MGATIAYEPNALMERIRKILIKLVVMIKEFYAHITDEKVNAAYDESTDMDWYNIPKDTGKFVFN